jgi:hypothetical protein
MVLLEINNWIDEWKDAVEFEKEYVKAHKSQTISIQNGTKIINAGTSFYYTFECSDMNGIQEGMPVLIIYNNVEVKGEIIGIDQHECVVKIATDLGASVEKAEMITESWEVLEALGKRLETLTGNREKQRKVEEIFSLHTPPTHPVDRHAPPLKEVILRSYYNPVTYIWGPPGTGKTYTLARIAAHQAIRGKKVLVTAHSNAAVDVLLNEIYNVLRQAKKWKSGKVVRVGNSMQINKELLTSTLVEEEDDELASQKLNLLNERSFYLKNQLRGNKLEQLEKEWGKLNQEFRKKELEFIESALVVGTTLSKVAMEPLIYERNVDLAVIDEVSMAYVPHVAWACSLSKHSVICGDFKQLPPVAESSTVNVNKWLKQDVFHHASIAANVEKGTVHPHLFILDAQRRMPKEISSFTNEYVYRNFVGDHKVVEQKKGLIAPFENETAVLINIENMNAQTFRDANSHSHFNIVSGVLSAKLAVESLTNTDATVGIITPYKAQAQWITFVLEHVFGVTSKSSSIIVSTVHKFQGSERDVILFDLTDSSPERKPGRIITDEQSDRLLNVAISRTKEKLIQIADATFYEKTLPKNRLVKKWIAYLKQNQNVYDHTLLEKLNNKTSNRLNWFNSHEVSKKMSEDSKGVEKIYCSFKSEASIPLPLKQQVQKLYVITPSVSGMNINANLAQGDLPEFIIIGQSILWVKVKNENTMYMRLHSQEAIQQLIQNLDLDQFTFTKRKQSTSFIGNRDKISLNHYISTWCRCFKCDGRVNRKNVKSDAIKLDCESCGFVFTLPVPWLTRFVEHYDLSCKTCRREYEVNKTLKGPAIHCSTCDVTINLNEIW